MTCWPKVRDWTIDLFLTVVIGWLSRRAARLTDSSAIEAERLVPPPAGWRDRT